MTTLHGNKVMMAPQMRSCTLCLRSTKVLRPFRSYRQQRGSKPVVQASSALATNLVQPLTATSSVPYSFAAFPYALPAFSLHPPSFFTVLGFLLSHPFVTLSLAVFLYVTIPRLWRAFIKYVVIPSAVLGAGIVVVRNPDSFRSAGVFVSHFSSDHPYVTSSAILIVLTLVLSPYVLTALLALFVATGIPRLPAPIRNFLPAPVLEIEQTLTSFDSVVRGPINVGKEKAAELTSGLTAKGSTFFSAAQTSFLQNQQSQRAPSLTDKS